MLSSRSFVRKKAQYRVSNPRNCTVFGGSNLKLCRLIVAVTVAGWLVTTQADDYYVDNVLGKDTCDGMSKMMVSEGRGPFATIKEALSVAGAGDTVHLQPNIEPYRELMPFKNKQDAGKPFPLERGFENLPVVHFTKGGEAGRPITLDGHGAVISGSVPCSSKGWIEGSNGVFSRTDVVSHYILIVNDELVFEKPVYNCLKPGEIGYYPREKRLFFRPSEGKKAADYQVEVKQEDGTVTTVDPMQWSPSQSKIKEVLRAPPGIKTAISVKINGVEAPFVLSAKDCLEPGEWCVENGNGAGSVLYYRPPVGKRPSDLRVECSLNIHGLVFGGRYSHLVIKNLNVVHVWDDGYNLSGEVRDIQFINCNARHCGDQGFSAHGTCETVVDGAVYEDCSQGVANTDSSVSVTRNVVIAHSRGPAFLVPGDGRHELQNAVLVNNPSGIRIIGPNTRIDNVLIVNTPQYESANSPYIGLEAGGDVEARRLTVAGKFAYLVRSDRIKSIQMENCLFATEKANWHFRFDKSPVEILKLKNILAAPGASMTWGSKPPWQNKPFVEWLKDLAKTGAAVDAREATTDFTEAILDGRRPEGVPETVGCDQSILDRFRAFLTATKK